MKNSNLNLTTISEERFDPIQIINDYEVSLLSKVQELIENDSSRIETLKTLITISDNVEEADNYVRKFHESLNAKNQVDVTILKYLLVKNIFNVGGMYALPNRLVFTDKFKAVDHEYKLLLSPFILQDW